MTTFPVSVPDYTDPHWSSRSIGLHRTLHRLITLILRSGVVSVRVGGLDEIPERGPAVLMSNHESNVDPFLSAMCSVGQCGFRARPASLACRCWVGCSGIS